MIRWWGILALVALLGACAQIGPRSIANGRNVYNDVLNRTADEQILNMLVKIRYEETYGMLMVSNVTSNIKIRQRFP